MLMHSSSSSSEADSPLPTVRRRNSIATTSSIVVVPTTLRPRHFSTFPAPTTAVSSSSAPPPPPLNFELISLKAAAAAAYTSLKDIIPSSPTNSPTAAGAPGSPLAGGGSYPIPIRNRLVKQAAWAYLQPMSASPTAGGPTFLRRLRIRLSAAQSVVASCLHYLRRRVAGAFDLVLRALRIRTDR